MEGFCPLVFSLTWLLLLLNLLLQVILAMPKSYSFDCALDEYWSKDVCCKTCPAGTFVQKPCMSPHTQGQCEKCHPGTFTGSDNGLDDCRLCSTCDKDQEMVADCSATSDRKCQCQTGLYYFDPKFPESCRPCTKCPQGIPVLQECNPTANTVCSSSASNPRNRLFLLLPPSCMLILPIVVFCIRRRERFYRWCLSFLLLL
ncbi:tumor necrosis factor receptor superfamily member 23-like [Mus pahari]|uniref:tumor necrosis factor receptor superfamily member 23-like n=1 Tax=Mus pahari TaxID=10093 RepID=UPI00111482D2|nr:tumor necrosis factor receptor superfamily member 23-like [Mus pahari]